MLAAEAPERDVREGRRSIRAIVAARRESAGSDVGVGNQRIAVRCNDRASDEDGHDGARDIRPLAIVGLRNVGVATVGNVGLRDGVDVPAERIGRRDIVVEGSSPARAVVRTVDDRIFRGRDRPRNGHVSISDRGGAGEEGGHLDPRGRIVRRIEAATGTECDFVVHETLDVRVEKVRLGDIGERIADMDRPGMSVGGVNASGDRRRLHYRRVYVDLWTACGKRRSDYVA